jgi:hypothetical protein
MRVGPNPGPIECRLARFAALACYLRHSRSRDQTTWVSAATRLRIVFTEVHHHRSPEHDHPSRSSRRFRQAQTDGITKNSCGLRGAGGGRAKTSFRQAGERDPEASEQYLVRPGYPLWVIGSHCDLHKACPLYPQKRTLVERVVMSALCQKQT